MMTDVAAAPKYRWVFSSLDSHWQLREVGRAATFATVYSLSSDLHRRARRAGYYFAVYIQGEQVAYFQDSKAAMAWAFAETEAYRAEHNSIAWEAGRPGRQQAARAAEEARARFAAEAKARAFARKAVTLKALEAFIAATSAEASGDAMELATAMELRAELTAELARLADA